MDCPSQFQEFSLRASLGVDLTFQRPPFPPDVGALDRPAPDLQSGQAAFGIRRFSSFVYSGGRGLTPAPDDCVSAWAVDAPACAGMHPIGVRQASSSSMPTPWRLDGYVERERCGRQAGRSPRFCVAPLIGGVGVSRRQEPEQGLPLFPPCELSLSVRSPGVAVSGRAQHSSVTRPSAWFPEWGWMFGNLDMLDIRGHAGPAAPEVAAVASAGGSLSRYCAGTHTVCPARLSPNRGTAQRSSYSDTGGFDPTSPPNRPQIGPRSDPRRP